MKSVVSFVSLPRKRFTATFLGSIAALTGLCAVGARAFDPPITGQTAPASTTAQPPKIGDKAPDFTLNGLDGKKQTLSSFTKKGPVTLIVLRGFPGYQCPICTMQVGELVGKSDQFAAKKTPVVLVYPGPSQDLQKRANEFVTGKNLPANFTFLIDPDYAMVNKYGLRWDKQGETAYPSTFVLDKGGKIVFAKISHTHGGRAKADEILAVLPQSK